MPHFNEASGFFWNADLEEDGALSGIAAHLQGGRRTFTDYCALARKDTALARKTAHFWDCGELGTIAARPTNCGTHGWEKSGTRYATFSSAGAAHLLHSF